MRSTPSSAIAIMMEMRRGIKRAAVKFIAEKWQRAWRDVSKDLIKRDIIYSVAFALLLTKMLVTKVML